MIAQKNHLALPSYVCTKEGLDHLPRFKATVTFNGQMFESEEFHRKQKDAENAAAKVALRSLEECENSTLQGVNASCGEHGSLESKVLLLDAAQKARISCPFYITSGAGPSHSRTFTSIVQVAGMKFIGESLRTKKQAEKSAASAAWNALKKVASDEEKHFDGETHTEFDMIVNMLERNSKDECGTSPTTPTTVTNMYKDAPAIKRIRLLAADEEKAR